MYGETAVLCSIPNDSLFSNNSFFSSSSTILIHWIELANYAYAKLLHISYEWNFASANGGPRSWVCARETPIDTSGNLLAKDSAE
jgi:hypothetical protein